jgi:hypothetical protein
VEIRSRRLNVPSGVSSPERRSSTNVLKLLEVLDLQEAAIRPPNGLKQVLAHTRFHFFEDYLPSWRIVFEKWEFRTESPANRTLSRNDRENSGVFLWLGYITDTQYIKDNIILLQRWQKVSVLIGFLTTLSSPHHRLCSVVGVTEARGKHHDGDDDPVLPCWTLPQHYNDMLSRLNHPKYNNSHFILYGKDDSEAHLATFSQLSHWRDFFDYNVQEAVVYRFHSDPFLIDGYQWQFYATVLITSIQPLRAYIYHDGIVEFDREKFDLRKAFGKVGQGRGCLLTAPAVKPRTQPPRKEW